MKRSIEFYTQRAEEAAKEAKRATLNKVRERALRSEAAWRKLATKTVHPAQHQAVRS